MKALIFDIKRFALHDGPGIRTTLFFKGCPLQCQWCHNPESRSCSINSYNHTDRIGDKEFVTRKEIGTYYSIQELIDEARKDEVFYAESSGGITCSGGEPLQQSEFVISFLKKCKKESIHTAVDTTGYIKWEILERITTTTDLFLYDIKHLDPVQHKKFTGVDNDLILNNFKKLIERKNKTIARLPIIPGFNEDEQSMNTTIDFLSDMISENFNEVHLLPYHNIGESKYKKFNISKKNSFNEPDSILLEEYAEKLKEKNFKVKIGG